jgi:hypothetical protein
MTAAEIQAAAAIATFFASLSAVWAAFRAPKIAAEFAENLRANSSAQDENRRLKLFIFSTLMQHRGSILAEDSLSAINLIDVVFVSSPQVREARRDFMNAATTEPFVANSLIERFFNMIHSITQDLGLNEKITISDIRSVYFPRDKGERAELELLERQQKLNALRGATQLKGLE